MPTEKFDLRTEELKKAKNLLEGIRAIKQHGGGASIQTLLYKLKKVIALKNFERTDLLSFSTEEELQELGI